MNAHSRGLRGRNVHDAMLDPNMPGGKPRRAVCPCARSLTFSRAMQTA
ncbi:MAG TPA: hypothetical protein VJV97_07290 [Gemmatimonadaceae bacterium]|nr:hypothetical protein [Gemmatimonadaceae bacterium]